MGSGIVKIMLKYLETINPDLVSNELYPNRTTFPCEEFQLSDFNGEKCHAIEFANEDFQEVLFREYEEIDGSGCRWEINQVFDELYRVFGEKNFEDFVESHYMLNITNKKGFKHNWLWM